MKPRRRTALALVAMAVLAVRPSPLAAPKTEEIMARAGAYLSDFVGRFSSLVAEELFVQDARKVTASGKSKGNGKELVAQVTIHRELVSDYLLVKAAGVGEWHTFRDIFRVDGRPVRDRDERLSDLFLQPAADAVARATEIVRDGARYNIGDPERTLNNPLLALAFLQPQYQSRFKFSLKDADPAAGPDVWIVEYREQARPTLLRRLPDGDLPARGRVWIDDRSGRVLRTELTVSDNDEITTWFRFDERFQIALPVEMRESYWNGNEYVTGVARYDRFRQFAVQTEENIDTDRIR